MANYDSPKAAGRDLSQPKTPALGGGKFSNQEQFTGDGKKVMGNPQPSSGREFSDTPRTFSNQVQFASNPFGSNVLKDPLSRYKQKMKPAAVNPGPDGRSQGTKRTAAGRTVNGGPSGF